MLFSYDAAGAQASANLFSLVMTCRANEVEPYAYLNYLFEHLPAATTVSSSRCCCRGPSRQYSTNKRRHRRHVSQPSAALTRRLSLSLVHRAKTSTGLNRILLGG